MVDVAKLAIEVDSTQATTAAAKLDKLSTSSGKAAASTTKLSASVGASKNNLRNMSLQLSQVAQQGSVTGNYLQALAIQLPDLLLGFGTLGIAIGAVAGSIAGPLFSALTSTNAELESFNNLIDDTKGGLRSVRLEATEGAINTLKDNIKASAEEMERLQKIPDKIGGRAVTNNRRLKIQAERQEQIKNIEKDQIRNNEALVELDQRRLKLKNDINGIDEMQTAIPEQNFNSYNLSDFFAEQEQEMEKGQAKFNAMIRSNLNATLDAEQLAAQRFAESLQQNQELRDADLISEQQHLQGKIAAEEAYNSRVSAIRKKDADSRGVTNESTLQASASFFGNLASIADAGGKEQFESYKLLASAQAGISAALGALSVIGDASIPTALKPFAIGAVGALAAVQIAQIQSQEYSGTRQLGGQAQAGRSLLVGENGPEVLTMGADSGYITPNSALGGSSNVEVNVINNGSSQVEIQQEQISGKDVINILLTDISKGGPIIRGVMAATGTRRAGV